MERKKFAQYTKIQKILIISFFSYIRHCTTQNSAKEQHMKKQCHRKSLTISQLIRMI